MSAPPRTSVICAVWNQDRERHALLRGHMANLAAQTLPVQPIYVFDGGDPPPEWLAGTLIVAPQPLTIYQAWNVALQVARSEYVMNLNLDDRLAPDAVELLESSARANKLALVGGDWAIRYSQPATDEVVAAYPAGRLAYEPAWPPRVGAELRLGSGSGERGTLGPATLWRRDLHQRTPLPHQFGSGQPIRVVGDMVWWNLVCSRLGERHLRLPLVIGNYHSHPAEQAEFRAGDEHAQLGREGIVAGWYPLAGIEVRRPPEG